MTHINGRFYSFKNGFLFQHQNESATPTAYYNGAASGSSITVVSNNNPLEKKKFKAIGIDSTKAPVVDVVTNETGAIALTAANFLLKEGMYFSDLKTSAAAPPDFASRSAIGVGYGTVPGGVGIKTWTFPAGSVSSMIKVGDLAYYTSSPSVNPPQLAGTVQAVATSGLVTSGGPFVAGSYFVIVVKNQVAESQGILGDYAKVTITYGSAAVPFEMFAIEMDYMKSFP
jgi:hypothetical protein